MARSFRLARRSSIDCVSKKLRQIDIFRLPQPARQSCSFLVRSAMRLPSAALALARLVSAIEALSLTSTICWSCANGEQLLLRLLETQLKLLDFVLQKRLSGGVRLEALIEICGHEGVGVAVGYALRPLRRGIVVAHVHRREPITGWTVTLPMTTPTAAALAALPSKAGPSEVEPNSPVTRSSRDNSRGFSKSGSSPSASEETTRSAIFRLFRSSYCVRMKS